MVLKFIKENGICLNQAATMRFLGISKKEELLAYINLL
jgi:hypothetical protein